MVFTGTPYGLEERLIPSQGFRLVKIEARPFSGRSPAAKARTLFTLIRGTVRGRRVIRMEKPDAILGMGGFTSVPVVLAGLYSRVPCFIHEQNVYPGMANRLLGWGYGGHVYQFCGYRRAFSRRATQYIRATRSEKSMRGKRAEKNDGKFNIFVFGGSRGARTINEGILALLPYLEAYKQTGLYHQTGGEDFARVAGAYKGSSTAHEVFPFTDQMEKYYNLADIVISRAGASTIFELSYFGKPAILVPYPFSAGGHQWKNASAVERTGGAYVIGNNEIRGETLRGDQRAAGKPGRVEARMKENIGSIYVEDAEQKVIKGIEEGVSQN